MIILSSINKGTALAFELGQLSEWKDEQEHYHQYFTFSLNTDSNSYLHTAILIAICDSIDVHTSTYGGQQNEITLMKLVWLSACTPTYLVE